MQLPTLQVRLHISCSLSHLCCLATHLCCLAVSTHAKEEGLAGVAGANGAQLPQHFLENLVLRHFLALAFLHFASLPALLAQVGEGGGGPGGGGGDVRLVASARAGAGGDTGLKPSNAHAVCSLSQVL